MRAPAVGAPAAPRGPAPVSLASAGRRQHPARILIHGQPGVGKSSWAAAAPCASFADFHRSTEDLAVWGREEPHPQRALTWAGALAVIDAAARKQGAQTLVVDAVTDLEALIWADVVAGAAQRRGRDERAPTNIEEVGGGYKKGYTAALESWRLLVQRLDGYQQQLGLHIVLVAHTRIMKQRNPGGLEYDRWAPALHEGAWEVLRAWVGDVFYAEVEAVTDRQDEEGRGRRRRRGRTRLAEHVMRTARTAGWDAKNREGYPDTMPLIGSEFWALRAERQAQAGRPAPSDLVGELAEVLEQLPPTHRTLRDGRPILDVARHDETLCRQWLARAEAALDAYLADQEPEEGEPAPPTAHQPAPDPTPGTPTPVPGAPAHGAESGGAGGSEPPASPAPTEPAAQKARKSRVRRARSAIASAAEEVPDQDPGNQAEPGEGLPGSEQ